MRSLPLRGRGGVGLVDFALMLLRLTAVERGVPLCARCRGFLRLQWQRFWCHRAGVDAGRALYRCQKLRCFVCCPHPDPPPRGEGVVWSEKRRRWVFWLRRFGRVVRRDGQRRGLLRLRWRRFWCRRARRVLCRCQRLRCFVCCPHPGPPPRGEGVEPWEKRRRRLCRLRYFAQYVPLCALQRALSRLR